MLKNPFLVYIAAFGSAIAIYQLGWSDLYPPLTRDLLLFFGFTFLASVLLARLIGPFVNQTQHYTPGLLSGYATLFVIGTFIGEIALNGIPLIYVLRGAKFYALEAKASHLHAFTFWSVFSAIRFADFLYSRRYRYLAEAALPLIFYILFVYRGPAIMCLLSWMFIFVTWKGAFKRKHIVFGTAALVLAGYLNGIMGDVRSPGQERVGGPSAAFQASGVPRTYFWTYLYATSPLANFQLAVSTTPPGQGTVLEFIASELLPDTLSKKILPMLNDRIQTGSGNLATRDDLYSWNLPQVAAGINIATLFGRSYGYFGWIGPVIMFAMLSALIIFYAILIRNSPYRVPALALLNVLVVFCLFNNMLASAAMLPQLVWPLLIPPWRHREAHMSDTASEELRAV